ncbi:hypothetical protein [Microbacterium sp. YY-01]|uniref:hypothetical protein n=1 Tax=Microbacterium sp. YY-01 TaxID=3421634 RepID=UPI003D17F1A6
MKLRLATAVVAAFVLAFTATGCAAEAPVSPKADADSGAVTSEQAPEEVVEVLNDALSGPDADGDDDRAFGATREMVIEAVEKTFKSKNARATWDDTILRVELDGSVDDPVASLPCSALEALLADGEAAVIVFEDGDLICADRYNNG